jgi:hypothetical protein
MREPGRRIELIVRVAEPELLQQSPRGVVFGIVAGKEARGTDTPKGMVDDTRGSFEPEAMPPMPRPNVDTKLKDVRALVGSQATAAHVLASSPQEHRPILHPVVPLSGYFLLEPLSHVLQRKRPSCVDQPGDPRVSPQADGKSEIFLPPRPKAQARRLEKITLRSDLPSGRRSRR